jgi:hypothetical protein
MISKGTKVSTRVPEVFNDPASEAGSGIYAWMLDEGGALVPSGLSFLSAGQAWEYDGDGALVPTGAAITDDLYWTYDGDGALVPR